MVWSWGVWREEGRRNCWVGGGGGEWWFLSWKNIVIKRGLRHWEDRFFMNSVGHCEWSSKLHHWFLLITGADWSFMPRHNSTLRVMGQYNHTYVLLLLFLLFPWIDQSFSLCFLSSGFLSLPSTGWKIIIFVVQVEDILALIVLYVWVNHIEVVNQLVVSGSLNLGSSTSSRYSTPNFSLYFSTMLYLFPAHNCSLAYVAATWKTIGAAISPPRIPPTLGWIKPLRPKLRQTGIVYAEMARRKVP